MIVLSTVLCCCTAYSMELFIRKLIFPAVPDMVKMRVAFHSELGVRYLRSLRQASFEWKSNDYREDTPLLRERFTTLLTASRHVRGFLFFYDEYRIRKELLYVA